MDNQNSAGYQVLREYKEEANYKDSFEFLREWKKMLLDYKKELQSKSAAGKS